MENPNLAVPPDYTSNEFEEERSPFVDAGLTPLQAADALRNRWTVLNNRSKALWQQAQHEANEARVATQERADQLKAQQDEDEAQILREERKKNKTKFAPIPNRAVSSRPLILPSLIAIHKLKAHQFCELWYFTNTGLDEAEKSFSYAADGAHVVTFSDTDGQPGLTISPCTRPPRSGPGNVQYNILI